MVILVICQHCYSTGFTSKMVSIKAKAHIYQTVLWHILPNCLLMSALICLFVWQTNVCAFLVFKNLSPIFLIFVNKAVNLQNGFLFYAPLKRGGLIVLAEVQRILWLLLIGGSFLGDKMHFGLINLEPFFSAPLFVTFSSPTQAPTCVQRLGTWRVITMLSTTVICGVRCFPWICFIPVSNRKESWTLT